MTILRFDEVQLVRDLEHLSVRSRAAFAAACAERLRPAYLAFSQLSGRGDAAAFEAILDELWSDLERPSMTDEIVDARIETCMALIPQEDAEPWLREQDYGEDAGAALVYALGSRRNGNCQEAAWAARCVYDSLDTYVTDEENIDKFDAVAEARILSHPLIQIEFARQRRDLEELRAAGDNPDQAIRVLRERAKRDAPSVFKVLS